MSDSIENRIINLQFNNKDFEKNAAQSMKTLSAFEKSLNGLKGVKTGLDTTVSAFKKFGSSIGGIANDVQKAANWVSNFGKTAQNSNNIAAQSFSFLENISIGAMRRIGEQALQTGEHLVKSLTIDQISAGWSKFGEKTRSVASIMSATGMSAEEVSDSLKKLNWYTDETSYAYTDMTNNISKFTSAGIELDDAVTAMIGIGNAAGLAGSSVQDASHAMMGFSKAMAKGYMDYQNWSWIETAHMDTVQFKQELINAAEELGVLAKGAVTVDTLTSTLTKDKWLTRDVMTTALKAYGGTTETLYEFIQANPDIKYTSDAIDALGVSSEDLGLKAFKASQEARTFSDAIDSVQDAVSTGLMTAFEHLIGNYDEAKELWTDLANNLWDVFADPIDRLNSAFEDWEELGGHDLFRSSLYKFMDTIATYIEVFKSGIREVFGEISGNKLLDITKRFSSVAEAFEASAENGAIDKISNGWKSLLTVFKAVGDGIRKVEGIYDRAHASFIGSGLSDTIDNIVRSVDDVTDSVKEAAEMADKAFQAISDIWLRGKIGNGQDRVKGLEALGLNYDRVQSYINKLADGQYKTMEDLHEAMLADSGSFAKTAVKDMESVSDAVEEAEEDVDIFGKALAEIDNVFTRMAKAIRQIFQYANSESQLTRIFIGVFNLANIAKEAIDQLNSEVFDTSLLKSVTHMLVNPMASLADKITEFANSNEIWKIRDIVTQIRMIAEEAASTVTLFGTAISDAFTEVLGGTNPVNIFRKALIKIRSVIESIVTMLKANNRLTRIFSGLISAIKIVVTVIKELAKVLEPVIGTVLELFLDILANISDILVHIAKNNGLETIGTIVANVFGVAGAVILKVYSYLKLIIGAIAKAVTAVISFFTAITSRLKASEGIQKLSESFKNLATKISGLFETIFNKKNDTNNMTKSLVVLGDEGKDSFSWLDGIVGLLDILASGMATFLDSVNSVISKVQEFVSAVSGNGDAVAKAIPGENKTIFDKISEGMSGIFSNVDNEQLNDGSREFAKSSIGGFLSGIVEAVKSLDIDWSKVFIIGTIIGFIQTLIKINSIIGSVDKFMQNLKKWPLGINEIFGSIKGVFDQLKTFIGDISKAVNETIKIKKIQVMVESIVSIVLAIALLSQIPENQLYKAVKYLTISLIIIGLFLKFLDKLKMFNKQSTGTIDNSISNTNEKGLQVLSGNYIDFGQGAAAMILSIAGLALSIGAAMKMMGDIEPDRLVDGGIVLAAAALGVVLIMKALAKISQQMSNVTSQTSDSGDITVMHKREDTFWSMAGVLVSFSIFFRAISKSITELANLPIGHMWSAVGALAVIGLILVGIMEVMARLTNAINKEQGADGVKRLGITMILMASAMSIIVGDIILLGGAMALLGLLPLDVIGRGALALFGIASIMILLIAAIGSMAEKASAKQILAIGGAFIIMSVGLAIMVGSLIALVAVIHKVEKDMPNDAQNDPAMNAFAVLAAAFVALAVTLYAVAKHSPDGNNLMKVAASLVIASLAFVVIAAAFAIAIAAMNNMESDMQAWGLVGVVVAFGVIFGALAGLMAIMNKLNMDSDGLIKIATALVIASASILVIAIALDVIADALNRNSDAGKTLLAIAIGLGVFMVVLLAAGIVIAAVAAKAPIVITAMKTFGVVLKGLGIVLLGIAAVFLAFGASLWLVGEALPKLTAGLPGFVDALGGLIDLIEHHFLTFALITAIILALSAAVGILIFSLVRYAGPIGEGLGKILDSIGKFLEPLKERFNNLPKKTQNTIKMVVVALVAGLAAATPEVMHQIGDTILKVLKYLADFAPFIINAIVVLLVEILHGLASSIRDNSGEIVYAIFDVLEALFEIILDVVYALIKMATDQIIGVLDYIPGLSVVSDTISGMVDNLRVGGDELKGMLQNSLASLGHDLGVEIDKTSDQVNDKAESAGTSLWDTIKNSVAGSNADDAESAISDKMAGIKDLIGGSFDMDSLTNAFTGEDGVFDTTQFTQFTDAINMGSIDISNFSEDSIMNIQALADENGIACDIMSDDMFNLSDNTAEAYGDMLVATSENSEDANKAVNDQIDKTISDVKSKRQDMHKAGMYLMFGLRDGINDEYPFVRNTLIAKFQDIVDSAAATWQIESPSKVFYSLGAFAMMGLSNGGVEYGKKAEDAFTTVISNISDAIDLSEDWQPTIVPIVDMTNVRNSADSISGMFPNRSFGLASNNSVLDAQRRNLIAEQNQNGIYSDDNVINSIRELQGEVNNLNNSMLGMRVVMDTGALVGVTAGPMDNALGRRAQRIKRGG